MQHSRYTPTSSPLAPSPVNLLPTSAITKFADKLSERQIGKEPPLKCHPSVDQQQHLSSTVLITPRENSIYPSRQENSPKTRTQIPSTSQALGQATYRMYPRRNDDNFVVSRCPGDSGIPTSSFRQSQQQQQQHPSQKGQQQQQQQRVPRIDKHRWDNSILVESLQQQQQQQQFQVGTEQSVVTPRTPAGLHNTPFMATSSPRTPSINSPRTPYHSVNGLGFDTSSSYSTSTPRDTVASPFKQANYSINRTRLSNASPRETGVFTDNNMNYNYRQSQPSNYVNRQTTTAMNKTDTRCPYTSTSDQKTTRISQTAAVVSPNSQMHLKKSHNIYTSRVQTSRVHHQPDVDPNSRYAQNSPRVINKSKGLLGRGGSSGAITNRDSTVYSKSAYGGPSLPQKTQPAAAYRVPSHGGHWNEHPNGTQTSRGSRGMLGKFLESLKSTLGMNYRQTNATKGQTDTLAQDHHQRNAKATTATTLQQSINFATTSTQPKDNNVDARLNSQVVVVERPTETGAQFSNIATKMDAVRHHGYVEKTSSNNHEVMKHHVDNCSSIPATTQVKQFKESSTPFKPPRLNFNSIVNASQNSSSTHLEKESPSTQQLTPIIIATTTTTTTTTTVEDRESSSFFQSPMNDSSRTNETNNNNNNDVSPGSPFTETPGSLRIPNKHDTISPAAITPSANQRSTEAILSVKDTLQKFSSKLSSPSNTQQATPQVPKIVRFSWIVARALIKLQMQPAETFSLNGVAWISWELHKIPTLGASPTSCRVQEMYKATIPAAAPQSKSLRAFVKSVPISIWRKQWENQNKWGGEYVTDGENFVMEAAALAFLQHYGTDLAPKLLGVLELSSPVGVKPQSRRKGNLSWTENMSKPTNYNEVTHIVIVSELYGEDLLDLLERREKEKIPLTEMEKKTLQIDCLTLLRRLHQLGLAHLDFTPENVLYGHRGLRLCDFAKATPIWSNNLRHVKATSSCGPPPYLFESCEPTVGKGAYMPPECWRVYWRLEDTRIQYPLEELWSLTKSSDRHSYYFKVAAADVYMAGVLLFWLWSEGCIWKCSDVKQDEKYHHLIKSGLNFDLFRECRTWPCKLKEMLQAALRPDPRQRSSIDEFIGHTWFDGCHPSQTRERWQRFASFQDNKKTVKEEESANDKITKADHAKDAADHAKDAADHARDNNDDANNNDQGDNTNNKKRVSRRRSGSSNSNDVVNISSHKEEDNTTRKEARLL